MDTCSTKQRREFPKTRRIPHPGSRPDLRDLRDLRFQANGRGVFIHQGRGQVRGSWGRCQDGGAHELLCFWVMSGDLRNVRERFTWPKLGDRYCMYMYVYVVHDLCTWLLQVIYLSDVAKENERIGTPANLMLGESARDPRFRHWRAEMLAKHREDGGDLANNMLGFKQPNLGNCCQCNKRSPL